MIALPLRSTSDATIVTGVHPDRWCEPYTSARLRGSIDIGIGTAGVWVRPDERSNATARLAIQLDDDQPFVCDVRRDRRTYIGFALQRAAGEAFVLSFHCDSRVQDKGSDKRDLSFVLSTFALTAEDAVVRDEQHREVAAFGEFAWTLTPTLQGQLFGVPAGTEVKAFIDFKEIADGRTDEEGLFELAVAKFVVGHRPRSIRIAAGSVSVEIDALLDPQLIGEARQVLSVPVTQHSTALSACSPVTSLGQFAFPTTDNGVPGEWLRPLLQTMVVQTQALHSLLCATGAPVVPAELTTNHPAPAWPLPERYGPLIESAATPISDAHDVIWLGVIDWDFRLQRPQHLATQLARSGCRVFYVSIVFGKADAKGRFEIVSSPEHGVYQVRVKLTCSLPENIYRRLEPEVVSEILQSLDEMIATLSITNPNVVVQYPSWTPVAFGIPGATVVHDCLDLVSGFDNTPEEIVQLEHELVRGADVVVTTSHPLKELVAEHRSSTVIRNGCEIDFFRKAAARSFTSPYKGKVIGYFGAIAHWFEADWVARAAEAHPDWTLVLIGGTDGADLKSLSALPNVILLGERPYSELVDHLAYFDVTIIPFKLLDLILCTNPVKMYEYMAAGKPVVASPMPEVIAATELVYIAENEHDFVDQIERALLEDNDELKTARMAWAEQHSWESRATEFRALIDAARPKVSVVILSYRNWEFTKATLWSVLAFSDYGNLEIIVVDNGSGEEIARKLRQFALRDRRIKLVFSEENLGYAAGNNLGLKQATGEYVILLNNDTYVTKGWVKDLIRPLEMDETIGLVSPLTNNIGNEQKLSIDYANMEEMAYSARKRVRERSRQRLEVECVAFFCVATRRQVIEEVGLLDERYGLGFFEDDDYCKRVLKAGYRIEIVDDVFVHHHLSASFDQLGSDRKKELMLRNKAIFEDRWGKWKPHSHRPVPGFG